MIKLSALSLDVMLFYSLNRHMFWSAGLLLSRRFPSPCCFCDLFEELLPKYHCFQIFVPVNVQELSVGSDY